VKAMKGVLRCLGERLSFVKVKKLYLPSSDGKLYNSCHLTVQDNPSFAERLTGDFGLPFLLDFHQQTLHVPTEVAIKLLCLLPEQIRPQTLSTAFKECIKTAENGEADAADIGIVNMITSRLSDSLFRQGLYRLALHVLRCLGKLNETHVEKMKRLIAALDHISVVKQSRLTTYLDYVGKFPFITEQVRNQIRCTSEAICPYFVDHHTVYIGTGSECSLDSLYGTLAEVINTMTNKLLTSVLHHVYIILRCNAASIEHHLDRVNIRPCDNFTDSDPQV